MNKDLQTETSDTLSQNADSTFDQIYPVIFGISIFISLLALVLAGVDLFDLLVELF